MSAVEVYGVLVLAGSVAFLVALGWWLHALADRRRSAECEHARQLASLQRAHDRALVSLATVTDQRNACMETVRRLRDRAAR